MQIDVIPLANEIASKRQSVQLNLVTDLLFNLYLVAHVDDPGEWVLGHLQGCKGGYIFSTCFVMNMEIYGAKYYTSSEVPKGWKVDFCRT